MTEDTSGFPLLHVLPFHSYCRVWKLLIEMHVPEDDSISSHKHNNDQIDTIRSKKRAKRLRGYPILKHPNVSNSNQEETHHNDFLMKIIRNMGVYM